jgi:hypothetical protein
MVEKIIHVHHEGLDMNNEGQNAFKIGLLSLAYGQHNEPHNSNLKEATTFPL